ncbi:MAG TPA: SGNH/GDSL hydrolase family protein [Myxococcota bacterium]|nr:SGNH/GDSL hydrolase family protein [Myxococcota bacterium]
MKFPRHVVGAPWGLRINEPGAVYRHKSPDVNVWFRINSEGMRADRDYPRAKPAATKRIVSLGDSFTVGYEVGGDETFSSVLERELRKAGLSVEVLNTGVSGFGNAEECLYLERDLFDYQPDLVLVSFYQNDLVDNVRSDLLRLENGKLVAGSPTYVPGGWLGDFLNRNALLNFLGGYSNAFAMLKERLNGIVKRDVVEQNLAQQAAATRGDVEGDAEVVRERRLAAAIFERIFRDCRGRGIPLLVQSIPMPNANEHPTELLEFFPDEFDVHREGVTFFPAKTVLEPHLATDVLYNVHSHQHWTPLAHRLAGEALARVILEQHLLGPAASGPKPARP